MATSQAWPLCCQQWGEKYFPYCNSVGLGQKNIGEANNATKAKDDIKDYIYLEDISKLVLGRQD